jgi:short subunit dehydrogenase-like uncharacterized protein
MANTNGRWLIYGANGYTGSRIARAARSRGLTPVLGGRNAATIGAMAAELGLSSCIFDLADAAGTREALRDVDVVAHCAGPFSATSAPMANACVATRTHYVDITGEIDVVEALASRNDEARAAGVALCPSMAFDIIPTDCLAATLKESLPDATHLVLGFTGLDVLTAGTLNTALEGVGRGMSRVREDGRLVEIPYFSRRRKLDFGDGRGEVEAFNIPWADVAASYYSTGIPNVEVYIPAGAAMARSVRMMRPLRPLLRIPAVVRMLQRVVSATQKGPPEEAYAHQLTHLVGIARNARGDERRARLSCPNGYRLSVDGVLMAVTHLLSHPEASGFKTPSMLMGARCVERLPDVTPIVVEGVGGSPAFAQG